ARRVVALGDGDAPDAAQVREPADQRGGEARRVDEDVPVVAAQEVALRAVRGLAGVAAPLDRPVEAHGKIARRFLRAALRSDRCRGTTDDRVQGASPARVVRGLLLDERLSGLQAAEDFGRELAAGVALDARLVHEQLAWDVFGYCQLAPRHVRCLTAALAPRPP